MCVYECIITLVTVCCIHSAVSAHDNTSLTMKIGKLLRLTFLFIDLDVYCICKISFNISTLGP